MLDGQVAVHGSYADRLHRLAKSPSVLIEASLAERIEAVLLEDLSGRERSVPNRPEVINPFAGNLEAPTEIIELHQHHGDSLTALTEQRDDPFEGLIRDVAAAFFRRLDQPVSWSELLDRGAWPIPSGAPENHLDW